MHNKSNIFTGAIVFVIALAFCFSACAENDLNFDVPAPPQSKFLDSKELRMGGRQIYTSLYGSDENAETVCGYYRNFFQQHEFQKIIDKLEEKSKKRLLRFQKDDLFVSISVRVKEDKTEVVVAKYLQAAGELPPEKIKPSVKDTLFALPKEDVAGNDLSAVPRPPQSVRIMGLERGQGATVMYTTSLDVDAVADFYRAKMPDKDWTLTNEIAAKKAVQAYEKTTGKNELGVESPFSDGEDFEQVIKDSYVLDFKANFGSARITIFPNFMDRKLGSMVEVIYNTEKS